MSRENYFNHGPQTDWNLKRLTKLVEVLGGEEWLRGKKVLDVGCGHGENGKALRTSGADVTFTDGREVHIGFLKEEGLDAFVMDQDKEWTVEGQFDLIVHWGVLYHLNNWKQDVKCALDHAPLVCLETEIWDTDEPTFEHKRGESDHYDQALNGTGTVLSAKCFEEYLTSLGATFTRFDDEDLDSHSMVYSWKEGSRPGFVMGQRRFWLIERKK
jgi:SAM-dependent methyltransferase